MVPVTIFISYAHEDEQLLNALKKQLALLRRQGLIDMWFDRNINAGQQWSSEIEDHLLSADIILLLISSDFMDSDYINNIELKRAMVWQDRKLGRVIPIILRPTDWEESSFRKLEVLPKDGKPITKWSDQDEAFLNVAKGIRAVVEEYSATVNPANRIGQRQQRIQADLDLDRKEFDSLAASKNLEKSWQTLKPTFQKWAQNQPPAEEKSLDEKKSGIIGEFFPDSIDYNERS
jgi:hypothetical protein